MNTTTSKFRMAFLLSPLFILLLTGFAHAQSKPWIAPAAAQSVKSTITADAAAIKAGKTLYTTNCAPCHGDKGKGDGPAAASLTPKPADHTSALMLKETDGTLFWKISEGRTPMPQYKKILTDVQRWQLIAFIRTLNKSK